MLDSRQVPQELLSHLAAQIIVEELAALQLGILVLVGLLAKFPEWLLAGRIMGQFYIQGLRGGHSSANKTSKTAYYRGPNNYH